MTYRELETIENFTRVPEWVSNELSAMFNLSMEEIMIFSYINGYKRTYFRLSTTGISGNAVSISKRFPSHTSDEYTEIMQTLLDKQLICIKAFKGKQYIMPNTDYIDTLGIGDKTDNSTPAETPNTEPEKIIQDIPDNAVNNISAEKKPCKMYGKYQNVPIRNITDLSGENQNIVSQAIEELSWEYYKQGLKQTTDSITVVMTRIEKLKNERVFL